VRLEPLEVWFQPAPGPLLPRLQPFLAASAMAQAGPRAWLLRWAITAAVPGRGLKLEAVLVVDGPETASSHRSEPGPPSLPVQPC